MKSVIRNILTWLKLDLTKNLEYDRLTRLIIKKHVKENSNCIDVGCHKGEISDLFLKYAPHGQHYCFEPIPNFFSLLKEKYGNSVQLFPFALAEEDGVTTFQYVKNAPAYSGIKQRKYDISNPVIEEIEVELKQLDHVISDKTSIDLIKIDVEGAEFGVLKGGKAVILKNKPVVIFECGLGASDYYGTDPSVLYSFIIKELTMKVSTLKSFVNNKESLSESDFLDLYNRNAEYYFVLHK